jgi:hypothetical protein
MIVFGWIPSISQPHFWFRKYVWNSENSVSGIHIFGQWSAEEAKDISLLKVGKELSENAPIFRNFMVELASNTECRRRVSP